MTSSTLDIRPIPYLTGNLCGRCTNMFHDVVAEKYFPSRWSIKLCHDCLTFEERKVMNSVISEGLLKMGVAV